MTAYNKNNPTSIQDMFNSIAEHYDYANGILSLQLHKRWNRKLVSRVIKKEGAHTYLDLCCGTGDIAKEYLSKTSSPCQAYLVDFCSNMLSQAKNKLSSHPFEEHCIHYVEADAQQLPFSDEIIDRATMAYGIEI